MRKREAWEDACLGVLRIVFGFLFLQYGLQKMFHIPPAEHPLLPMTPMTKMWFAAVIELIGGSMIILGIFTRFAAFIASGEMAIAYFEAHASKAPWYWPLQSNGIPAVAFCFVFLYFVFAGGGAFSLDRLIFKKKPSLA